jgi:hypothetical protein
VSSYDRTREYLNRQIADAQRKLEQLARIPAEDDFPHLAMVRVVVTPQGAGAGRAEELSYLLHKVIVEALPREARSSWSDAKDQHRWYFTGNLFQRGGSQRDVNTKGWMTWDQLCYWATNDVVVESWEEFVPMKAEQVVKLHLDDDTPAGTYVARYDAVMKDWRISS